MNEQVLTLEIITMTGQEQYKITWLEVETPSGNMTICLGHAPIVALLRKKGLINYQTLDGTMHSREIATGFVFAHDRTASIFVD